MPDAIVHRLARRAAHYAPLLVLVAAAACAPQGGPSPDDSLAVATAELDSIVLERTVCFGFCPAYRLSIDGAGRVAFASTNPRDSTIAPQSDSIAAERGSALLAKARDIGFFELPDEIDPAHPDACPVVATDHPSAIVTIAVGDTVKRVNHYHGCYVQRGGDHTDAYPDLTAFEAAIDSAAQVERWLRRP